MAPTFEGCYTHNNARLHVMYNKTTHFRTCIEHVYGLSHHLFTKGSRVHGKSRSYRVISIQKCPSTMTSYTGSEYLERMVCWKSRGFAKHSGVSQWVMMTDSTSHPDHIRVQGLNQSHSVSGVCNDSIYSLDAHFLWQDNLHPLDIIWQGLIDCNDCEPNNTFESCHGKDMDTEVSFTEHLHHLLILQMKSCPWILKGGWDKFTPICSHSLPAQSSTSSLWGNEWSLS